MIFRMCADVVFDRPISRSQYYISPGGYEIKDKDGNEHQFDFCMYYGMIDKENNRILHIEHEELDTDTFPEAENLEDFLGNIDHFTEFFIHVEGEVHPLKVQNVVFETNKYEAIPIDDNLLCLPSYSQ